MEQTGKIFFFEDKNFQGRHYECSSDCPELNSHFSRCNSIRVDGGTWVIYEGPQYMGYQYVLVRGEYPTFQSWNGFNDTIRSCRLINNPSSRFRIRIYERPDFSGQMIELSEDQPNLQDRWRYRDVHSAHVHDGVWVFYENPNYRGRQYLLEKAHGKARNKKTSDDSGVFTNKDPWNASSYCCECQPVPETVEKYRGMLQPCTNNLRLLAVDNRVVIIQQQDSCLPFSYFCSPSKSPEKGLQTSDSAGKRWNLLL